MQEKPSHTSHCFWQQLDHQASDPFRFFEHGYEPVRLLKASLETIDNWKELNDKAVICYLDGVRVQGVLPRHAGGKLNEAQAD